MHTLITQVGCTILLFGILMQFAGFTLMTGKQAVMDREVLYLMEEIREEGCVTKEIKQRFEERVETAFGLSDADAVLEGPAEPKAAGQKIRFHVEASLGSIPSGIFFSGKGEELRYKRDAAVYSERMPNP